VRKVFLGRYFSIFGAGFARWEDFQDNTGPEQVVRIGGIIQVRSRIYRMGGFSG